MPPAKHPLVDTFAEVLTDIQTTMRWKQKVLAVKLGVSAKTIGRYTAGAAIPPPSRRHGIVHALRDLPAPLPTRVSASLGVAADFAEGLSRPPSDPELARPQLAKVVEDVSEGLETSHSRARQTLTLVLTALVGAKLDAATALALLSKA
jgi:hypothetical protein